MNDPIAKARIARYAQSRRHAETAVSTALLVCEARGATDTQLADLADAVDALRAKQYRTATILSEAAIERRIPDGRAVRPPGMARTLAEIRATLAAIRDADPG